MDWLAFWMFLLLAPATVGVFRYRHHERRQRGNWPLQVAPPTMDERAGYRSPAQIAGPTSQIAPRVVRLAALSSFLFGSMAVPGACFAAFGVLFYGAGVLGIPGLLVAIGLWRAAAPLLSAEPEGVIRAARASRWSLRLNWAILALCFAIGAWSLTVPDYEPTGLMACAVGAYALLSLGQALLVCKAALTSAQLRGAAAEAAVATWVPLYIQYLLGRKTPQASPATEVAPFEPRVRVFEQDQVGARIPPADVQTAAAYEPELAELDNELGTSEQPRKPQMQMQIGKIE